MKGSIPEHTENLLDNHDEKDLIIVYSKYEDLLATHLPQDPTFMGKYVPQWFMTDCINDRRGITISPHIAVVCDTYLEMADFGQKSVKRETRKILFYYTKQLILVNGQSPF